ncbi:hypothetical protein ACM73O_30035 [Pseudomonas aeruginosa]|nr:hypothetical protein [Pseudomonas aeruginosa]
MADKNCSMCGGKGYYCEHSTVETCWCVKPTAEDDVIEIKAEAERTKDLARIANMLREDAEVFSSCDYEVEHYDKAADGIEWLIAEVERLRGQVDHLINQHMPREPIPDMPGWTRVIDADRLKAENEALRKIISECATACGAGCAPECTLEFMSMLPGEISSVVSRRAAAEIGKSMGGGE